MNAARDACGSARRKDCRRDYFGDAGSVRPDRTGAAQVHYFRQWTMRAMTTWFWDAYASWQKGGVENANGRLRRWLPRQIDIDKVSDQEIQDIVITANLTPRKCLGFKTPFQAILKELGKDVHVKLCCTWL
jgi:hypothetical protein